MPIEDFTIQNVADAVGRLEAEAKILAKKKEGLAARLAKLYAEKKELETKEKQVLRDIARLQTALPLLQEIPGGVRELHDQLHEARKNAVRDDITVRQASEFRVEVDRLEKELIAACQHPLIAYQEGYHDTYSADGDRSTAGERTCAICGLHEYEYSRYGGPGGNKALVAADHRLFARFTNDIAVQRSAFRDIKDLKEILAAFTDARTLDLLKKMTPSPTQ